ncbi:MAG: diguanylate cyclase (GGDEF)-like protein [Alphaproteobacteria bacterium]|jgi:diguanylate cyclase (GGDEF)-like protein
MKVFLINEKNKESEWLTSALQISERVASVFCYEKAADLDIADARFFSAFIIVSQEQFLPLRRQLSKHYSAKDLPCPILILSDSFNSFDVSGYANLTIDAFPVTAITPQILEYLLLTLRRDFRKDVRLKKLAHYDALTGATNRYLFTDRVKQAIARVKRVGESLSFMYFDLDKFKAVNDKYGHDIGDDYLRMFVNVVSDCIRDTDTFGRLGGDEFGLLLPKIKEDDAVALAKRIIKSLSKTRNIQNHKMSIKTSIGIVVAEENEDTEKLNYKNLTGYADKAVFIAKTQGVNQFSVYKNPEFA